MSIYFNSREQDFLSRSEHYEDRSQGRKKHLETSGRYFYKQIKKLLKSVVEPGKSVLCYRSDMGQFLDWVEPSRGVGVEIAPNLVEQSRKDYPQYEFQLQETEEVKVEGTFDYILLVFAVNDSFDVQSVLDKLRTCCAEHTRVVIVWHNYLWQPAIALGEKLGLKAPQPKQNWLSGVNLKHILKLSKFETVREQHSVLFPFGVPGLSWLMNTVMPRLPLVGDLCLVQSVVARPVVVAAPRKDLSVSVIIPCRNEAGNIEEAVVRTPDMGSHTELIFCDDKSTDGTPDIVREMQKKYPGKDIRLVEGPGICKARNVWTGFDAAEGDVLMILDGDLAVPPEELSRFYNAMAENTGEFINGARLIYPMQGAAMRLPNIFGNKFFAQAFSYVLRSAVTDTLCGTKVLLRQDYERMKKFRGTWGVDDRWGDYELLFGAAKINLKYVEIPVHYYERTYGDTKMTNRLKNGLIMLQMCFAALRHFR